MCIRDSLSGFCLQYTTGGAKYARIENNGFLDILPLHRGGKNRAEGARDLRQLQRGQRICAEPCLDRERGPLEYLQKPVLEALSLIHIFMMVFAVG